MDPQLSFQDCYLAGLQHLRQDDALGACRRLLQALGLQPGHADAHYRLALGLRRLGQEGPAERALLHAFRLRPQHLETVLALARLWQGQHRHTAAEPALRWALGLAPGRAATHFYLGLSLQQLQRPTEAAQAYRQALALQPTLTEAGNNLGAVLNELGQHEEAERVLQDLLRQQPASVGAMLNLGNTYEKQGRSAEAEALLRQVLQHAPQEASAAFNLANLLGRQRQYAEAEALLRQALTLAPSPATEVNLAFLLLAQGRYEEGWARHEARWAADWPASQVRITHPPQLPYPPWQGESLQGRRLLVVQEQGGGDMIQFVRYLPELLAQAPAQVTLTCPAPLHPLLVQLERPGLSVRTVRSLDELEAHDCWTLLMSLPLHLGTRRLADVPARIPYLQADPARQARWRTRLPPGRPCIGLVWKGSAGHRNDGRRSLPHLEVLAPLWQVSGLHFVSLQKGQGEDEAAAAGPAQALTHLGTDIQDFADSAAIVSQLDLVVCVDTAVAHLAGALGVPCWVMLPHQGTDWRWLHERADCPWYPSLRLFRQAPGEDWAAVVARVAAALRELSPG